MRRRSRRTGVDVGLHDGHGNGPASARAEAGACRGIFREALGNRAGTGQVGACRFRDPSGKSTRAKAVLYTHALHPLHAPKHTLRQTRHLGKRVCSTLSTLYAQASSALHPMGSGHHVRAAGRSGCYRPPGDHVGPGEVQPRDSPPNRRVRHRPDRAALFISGRLSASIITGLEERRADRSTQLPRRRRLRQGRRRPGFARNRTLPKPFRRRSSAARPSHALHWLNLGADCEASTPPSEPNAAAGGPASAISTTTCGAGQRRVAPFRSTRRRRIRRQSRRHPDAKNETPQGMWRRRNFVP